MIVARPARHNEWMQCVVVGIPARNEADRVAACLQSVLAAAAQLGSEVEVIVVLVADDCNDGTAMIAGLMAAVEPRLHVMSKVCRSAGSARAAAITRGLEIARAAGHSASKSIWIATTDADTVVSPQWLSRQLEYADAGAHAVAGTVTLFDDEDNTDEVADVFGATYELGASSHPHVHGANLGIRADAYRAAGGFPRIELAEDHALWSELKGLGYRCISPVDLPVATSARLRGRAVGGFADTIAELVL